MVTLLTTLVLVSAFFALVMGISALRAGLRLHRIRAALRSHLYSEIDQLAHRATELEESLAALGVLTNALGTSLRQTQRVLSFAGPRSHLARAFGTVAGKSDGEISNEREDKTPEV